MSTYFKVNSTFIKLALLTYLNYLKSLIFSLLLFGCLGSFQAFSQNEARVDSLKLLLRSARDTTRFQILSELFKQINRTDFEASLNYAKTAMNLAESMGDSVRVVEAGRMMGYSLADLGRNEDVIIILDRVIKISERNKEQHPELKSKLKFLYNNAGIAYMYLGKYDSSLAYHFKSLEIREQEENIRSMGTAQNNIGLVYFKLKNYDRALEYYMRSLEGKKALNEMNDVEKILVNIGMCYNGKKEPRKAIESFEKAIKSCNENCSQQFLKELNFGFGIAYQMISEYEISKSYLDKSLEIARKQNDEYYIIENLLAFGKMESGLKNYEGSIRYFNQANEVAQQSHFNELLINIYKELSTTYTLISNYEAASRFQGRYIKLKDSIYGEDLIKNLARVQTNYEQRENIKTIRLSNENLRLKDEQLQRQRLQYLFIVLVATLIILLATVLIWANRKQHRHNAALSEANRVIEEQNKALTKTNEELDNRVQEKTRDLLLANESLTQVNEELDNFIYRTSHDIRGPLVTLKGVCNVAMLDVKDELALDYMNRLDVTAGKLNSILTRLLFVNQINHAELVPTEIDFKVLIDNIIEKERNQALPPNFSIEYDVNPSVKIISDRELVGVILENLIDNAIKFYNTSDRISPFVKIMIRKSGPKQISIQVDDNGIGVNTGDKDHIFHLFVRASERSETGGIGLYLSKISTQRLGGEIVLRDTSDKGSTFLVFLPADLTPILEKRRELEELKKKDKAKREREAQLAKQKAQEPSSDEANSEKQKGSIAS